MNPQEARCVECDEFLQNPKNVTHLVTEMDAMKFGMNCGNCNRMNEVNVAVGEIHRI